MMHLFVIGIVFLISKTASKPNRTDAGVSYHCRGGLRPPALGAIQRKAGGRQVAEIQGPPFLAALGVLRWSELLEVQSQLALERAGAGLCGDLTERRRRAVDVQVRIPRLRV